MVTALMVACTYSKTRNCGHEQWAYSGRWITRVSMMPKSGSQLLVVVVENLRNDSLQVKILHSRSILKQDNE